MVDLVGVEMVELAGLPITKLDLLMDSEPLVDQGRNDGRALGNSSFCWSWKECRFKISDTLILILLMFCYSED